MGGRILQQRFIAVVATISLCGATPLIAPALPAELDEPGALAINEFLASNATGLTDADGETSDWIELHNSGVDPIDLTGWSLSDEIETLDKWTFPSLTIDGGEYVIVFASGKARTDIELATNFKLSAGGEFLALVDADGVVVDEFNPSFPQQFTDISFSRAGFHQVATPGQANGEPSAGVVSETVQTTVDRGFYDSTQLAELSTTQPGAVIRYTLDGSEPSSLVGIDYDEPIVVDSTTIMRARAVVPDFIPGPILTTTYLFPADVATQTSPPSGFPSEAVNGQVVDYEMDPEITAGIEADVVDSLESLPTLSVVTDAGNLFDPDTGIYVNATQSGPAWERPTSIELLDPTNTEPGFAIDAGLRIRGGGSRVPWNPKHSLRLFFRGEYGGDLEYPVFGSTATDSFEKIDLVSAQNGSWHSGAENGVEHTMLRDPVARDLQAVMGHPYARNKFIHLYLNGHYWGIYTMQERVSKEFAASYLGGDPGDYDVVKHDNDNDFVHMAADGDTVAWRSLWPLVVDQIVTPAEYAQIEQEVDLDSLIDLYLIYGYTAHLDGAPSLALANVRANNWYATRNRNGGKWQFYVHDAESSFKGYMRRPTTKRLAPFPIGGEHYVEEKFHPGWLHQALLSTPDYESRYLARADQLLRPNAIMGSDAIQALWDSREAELVGAVLAESARWGDASWPTPRTVDDWAAEVAWVETNWFPSRTETVRGQLGLAPAPPNNPPVIDSVLLDDLIAGAAVDGLVSASDPDGDVITISATGLPEGVMVNAASGAITGRAADAGTYDLVITATDSGGAVSAPTIHPINVSYRSPVGGLLLNEWNAVSSTKALAGGDPYWGTIVGNGGDWFELVVTTDHLDVRGWSLVLSDADNVDGVPAETDVFVFADQPELADLRSGTIITVSEDLPDDLTLDPGSDDWWINLQANSDDEGAFFTTDSQSNFDTNNDNWRLTILDSSGSVVASPSGEGIAGVSGIGSDEIAELEADPANTISPASGYDDGSDSTFGAPNSFDNRLQDFTNLRIVDPPIDTTEPTTVITSPEPDTSEIAGALTIAGTVTDNQSAISSVQLWLRDRVSGQWLQPNGTLDRKFIWLETTLSNVSTQSADWTFDTNLPDGRWMIGVRATDEAGNRSAWGEQLRFATSTPQQLLQVRGRPRR